MQFDSLTFAVFFALVLAAYWRLRSWDARKNLLLGASYVFYAAWNPLYVGLIFFSTIIDWLIAGWILRSDSRARRRALLLGSLIANLGLLAYFKYTGFLAAAFADLVN